MRSILYYSLSSGISLIDRKRHFPNGLLYICSRAGNWKHSADHVSQVQAPLDLTSPMLIAGPIVYMKFASKRASSVAVQRSTETPYSSGNNPRSDCSVKWISVVLPMFLFGWIFSIDRVVFAIVVGFPLPKGCLCSLRWQYHVLPSIRISRSRFNTSTRCGVTRKAISFRGGYME